MTPKGFVRPWFLVIALLFAGAGFGGYWFFLRPAAVINKSESPITWEQAIQQIRDLPEVRKYLSNVPHGRVEIDHESPEEWIIHVYEIKEDHTATMGWFTVDKKEGTVKKTL